MAGGAAGGFTGGFAGTLLNKGSLGDAIFNGVKGACIGAATGLATAGVLGAVSYGLNNLYLNTWHGAGTVTDVSWSITTKAMFEGAGSRTLASLLPSFGSALGEGGGIGLLSGLSGGGVGSAIGINGAGGRLHGDYYLMKHGSKISVDYYNQLQAKVEAGTASSGEKFWYNTYKANRNIEIIPYQYLKGNRHNYLTHRNINFGNAKSLDYYVSYGPPLDINARLTFGNNTPVDFNPDNWIDNLIGTYNNVSKLTIDLTGDSKKEFGPMMMQFTLHYK